MNIVFSQRIIKHDRYKPDLNDVTVQIVEEENNGDVLEIRKPKVRKQSKSVRQSGVNETVLVFGDVSKQEEEENTKKLKKLKESSESLQGKSTANDPGHISHKKCSICGKWIVKTYFRVHHRSHSYKPMYPCKLCGSRFTRKNDVRRHERLIHNTQSEDGDSTEKITKIKEALKCKVCEATFVKEKHFENHVRFIHPAQCPQELTDKSGEENVDDPDDILPENNPKGDQHNHSSDKKSQKDRQIPSKSQISQQDVRDSSISEIVDDQPVIVPATRVGDQPAVPANSNGRIEIVDSSGNIGRVLKVSQNVFMIVDCQAKQQVGLTPSDERGQSASAESGQVDQPLQFVEDKESGETNDSLNSQDAVQTLIDAVQELIETHEAAEIEDSDGQPHQKLPEDSANLVLQTSSSADVASGQLDENRIIAPGDLERLASQFPGSKFVIVNDMK